MVTLFTPTPTPSGPTATSLDAYGSDSSGVGGTSAWSMPDWVTGIRSFFPQAYRDRFAYVTWTLPAWGR